MGFTSTIAAAWLTSLVVLSSHSTGSRPGNRRRYWRWAVPALLIPIVAVLILAPEELIGRFGELAGERDLTHEGRAQMWTDTMRLIASSPWTGAGVGAYEQGLYRFKTAMPLNTIDFAHNDYLQFLAELGVIGAGLAAALALWVLGKVTAIALWQRVSPNWEFAVGLLGVFLTLAFHSLADFNFYLPANALVMAWLAGLAMSPGLKGG